MSNKITENEIELFAIELLEKQGYEYIYAPEYERDFEEVILKASGVDGDKKVPLSRYLRHMMPSGVLLYSYPDTLSDDTIAQV